MVSWQAGATTVPAHNAEALAFNADDRARPNQRLQQTGWQPDLIQHSRRLRSGSASMN
jgi:hypothetical protein